MAQINLLKQKADTNREWAAVAKVFARILVAVLVVLAGYYVWIYFQDKSVDQKIASTEESMSNAKSEAFANKDRSELLTRQQQLQALDKLISAHLYWSGLLPALASVTYNDEVNHKSAYYSSIKATSDGLMTLSATLPDLKTLDEYLQVFDRPDIIKNFNKVSIGAFHEVPQDNATVIKVDVKMDFNPQLLQYQSIADTAKNIVNTLPQNNSVSSTTTPSSFR